MQLLPANYSDAKRALALCERIDECKNWSDKAFALRSYAMQSKDQTLLQLAQRIQDRAIRRAGQLLLDVEREKAGRKIDHGSGINSSPLNRAIREADLSRRQANTMMEVARVPDDLFEQAVEATPPATVTHLAEMGTKPRERVQPEPYRSEWIDWTNAVEHLAVLPYCGLDVLAERRPELIDDLLAECRDALPNLKLWLQALEKAHGRQKTNVNAA